MDLRELAAHLSAQNKSALSATEATKLSSDRQKAMDYYLGDVSKDLPAQDGRSSAVSMDVADTVEGLMPQLMEVFAGGDEVVKFEPVGPEDVEAAQQETDYVNHVFMNRNPGFMVLYSIIKDALLQKVGICKVWWEKKEKYQRESYEGKTDDELAILLQSPEVQLVEHTEREDEQYGKVHDVVLETRKDYSCAKVMPIPPEEFGIDRDARSIPEATYTFHRPVKTVADLIADGYDEEQVRRLPTYAQSDNSEKRSRDSVDEGELSDSEYDDTSRLVQITEHYCVCDYEQNGKPQLYRVTTGGTEDGEVLRIDGKPDVAPYDVHPFAAITPVPITHRFFGRSIADLVMDIQRIKTALIRGMLDNVYLRNAPRPEISETHAGPNTIDDLLNVRQGAPIRTKQVGGLNWQVVPDVAGPALPVLEMFDNIREWRTGATRAGQGIDADALQNQTATAVNQVYSAAQSRVRLIARIFAETGIRDLFSLLHATIKKHGDKPQTVRLRNQWVPVDPRNWKTRDDVTVHVGLGDGSKMQRLAGMMQIAGLQKEAMAAGLTNLVTVENLYNTAKEITKLLGAPNTNTFFSDPKTQPPPQPQQDPKVIEAQGKLQLEQQKAGAQLQLDQQKHASDLQASQQQMVADFQLEQAKLEQEGQLKREQMAMEIQLKREQMVAEMALKSEQMRAEIALKQNMAEQSANIDGPHLGGQPG
jgi:hypothetical protein